MVTSQQQSPPNDNHFPDLLCIETLYNSHLPIKKPTFLIYFVLKQSTMVTSPP